MAGMLPGVECARRRRLHNNTSSEGCLYSSTMHTHNNSTRHSFSLYYPSNFESLMLSTSSTVQERNVLNYAYLDDDLGGPAREAKQKLDEKFREQWKLENPKRKRSFWWFLVAPVNIKKRVKS